MNQWKWKKEFELDHSLLLRFSMVHKNVYINYILCYADHNRNWSQNRLKGFLKVDIIFQRHIQITNKWKPILQISFSLVQRKQYKSWSNTVMHYFWSISVRHKVPTFLFVDYSTINNFYPLFPQNRKPFDEVLRFIRINRNLF